MSKDKPIRKKNVSRVRKNAQKIRAKTKIGKTKVEKVKTAPISTSRIDLSSAKTKRGRRHLRSKMPVIHEAPKTRLFMRYHKASHKVQDLLAQLRIMCQPFANYLSSKGSLEKAPFEETSRVEKLCFQHNASLFCVGCSSKKRPFHLNIGRLFDDSLLEMYEFAISNYKPCSEFEKIEKYQPGSKNLLILQGPSFDFNEKTRSVKNILVDFFSIGNPDRIYMEGIDRAIVLTGMDVSECESSNDALVPATGPIADLRKCCLECQSFCVLVQQFRIFNSANNPIHDPSILLEMRDSSIKEIGPYFILKLQRHQLPKAELWKKANIIPKEDVITKKKNITKNILGEKRGRIHVGTQDLSKLHTPHFH